MTIINHGLGIDDDTARHIAREHERLMAWRWEDALERKERMMSVALMIVVLKTHKDEQDKWEVWTKSEGSHSSSFSIPQMVKRLGNWLRGCKGLEL